MEEPVEVLVSALEHFSYCPRQCGLIHVEQTFDENLYTIKGRLAHKRVDAGESGEGPDARVLRGLPLWSDRLHLRGRADVVELRRDGPYPVEYKVGPPRGRHAAVQLCAQAFCLEEMFGQPVERGAIFHVAERRRLEIEFTASLRDLTVEAIEGVRRLLLTTVLPPAANDSRCKHCSLIDSCIPTVTGGTPSPTSWDQEILCIPDRETP